MNIGPKLEELEKPFPREEIGWLPKPKRGAAKGKCSVCGGWHGLPAMHVPFVGHAFVQRRLTEVFAEAWQFSVGEPRLESGIWIVHGMIEVVTDGQSIVREDVGTSPDEGPDAPKVAASDAFSRCCARLGIASYLWRGEVAARWADQDGNEQQDGVASNPNTRDLQSQNRWPTSTGESGRGPEREPVAGETLGIFGEFNDTPIEEVPPEYLQEIAQGPPNMYKVKRAKTVLAYLMNQ